MEVLTTEKILVVQTAFLGDAILTLPMIQKLKEKFPKSYISILCIPSTSEIFEHSPCVDQVFVYDKKGGQKSLKYFFALIKQLRDENFSQIISPHRSFRSTLIAFLSRAAKTIGFDNSNISFLYDDRKKYNKNIHEVARNLELIGAPVDDDKWRIPPLINVPADKKERILRVFPDLNSSNLIAIAPGSVWNTKIYPKDYFIQVMEYFVHAKYFIILLGGKEDSFLCKEIENRFDVNVKSFAGELTVIESIELLKNVKLLISNDSAPSHMAMAADIPALTIYCSTVAAFGFFPYNSKSKYISYDELDCKPCGIHGYDKCPINTFECGLKLMPQVIINKAMQILTT